LDLEIIPKKYYKKWIYFLMMIIYIILSTNSDLSVFITKSE